jgi:hypothetical protein
MQVKTMLLAARLRSLAITESRSLLDSIRKCAYTLFLSHVSVCHVFLLVLEVHEEHGTARDYCLATLNRQQGVALACGMCVPLKEDIMSFACACASSKGSLARSNP